MDVLKQFMLWIKLMFYSSVTELDVSLLSNVIL